MLWAVPRFFSHGWNQVCCKVATGTATDCGIPVNRFFSFAGIWYVLCMFVGFQWLRALLLTANTYKGTIGLFAPGCSQILQPRLESCRFLVATGTTTDSGIPVNRFFSYGWNLVCGVPFGKHTHIWALSGWSPDSSAMAGITSVFSGYGHYY